MNITVTEVIDGASVESSAVTITVVSGTSVTGSGLPDGGIADQVLTKIDATDGNAEWRDVAAVITPDAADIDFSPTGTIAATDVQAALAELDTEKSATGHTHSYEPAGTVATHAADTTSVHGITDTANLILEGDARLTDDRDPNAHAASHQDGGADELALDGSQITTGTVADARIASTIARDTEVTAAVTAHEGLSDPHPGYLTTAEGAAAYQPLDSDLTAIAALSTTSYGRALLATADLSALRTILGPSGTPSSTTYLRGDGTWATPGGTSIPSPDDIPASPDAFDYEFNVDNTSSLPSGWAWVNQGSATYLERYGTGTITAPGSASSSHRIIERDMPAGSSWTVTAKFTVAAQNRNYWQAGITLRDSTTGKFMAWAEDGTRGPAWFKWNSATSYNSESGHFDAFGDPTFYLQVIKNSASSYDFLLSPDGKTYLTFFSGIDVNAFAGTVNKIGFYTNVEYGSPGPAVACHWMRKTA